MNKKKSENLVCPDLTSMGQDEFLDQIDRENRYHFFPARVPPKIYIIAGSFRVRLFIDLGFP